MNPISQLFNKKWLPIFLVAGSFLSCEKIVEGLNENPNNPTDAPAPLILTGMELGNIAFHEGHTARIAGIWSGYFTGTDRQYRTMQDYVTSGSAFNESWKDVYYAVFQQQKLLEQRAAPLNNRWVRGIGRIIQAHAVGTAAACWGDVPYRQAADIERFPNPVFDPQKQVYDSVQVTLDQAIADLTSGIGTSPGASDIHFSGNATRWIQVAHTLKARYFLDVREYSKAYDEALLGIKTAAGSLLAPHGTSLGTQNLYSYNRSVTDMTSESAYLPKLLDPQSSRYRGNAKTNETARFNYYFTYTTTNGQRSRYLPNTLNSTTLRGIFGQTSSYALITYEENLLILAEAGFRTKGFDEGLKQLNAYRAYLHTGAAFDPTYRVAGNFAYLPYQDTDFQAGGLLNSTQMSASQALLHEILLERYISFFGQKLGFHDLRRTRKEAAAVVLLPNIGTALPERFVYPQDETNTNRSAPSPTPGVFEVTPVNKN